MEEISPADASTTTASADHAPRPQPAATVQPPTSPAPAAAVLTAAATGKEKRIANGVRFLSDPRIKTTPISRRVNFLKSKGLTAEEIVESFEKAGQPQSLDAINSLLSSAPAPTSAAAAAPQQPSSSLASTAAPITGVYVPQPQQPVSVTAPLSYPQQPGYYPPQQQYAPQPPAGLGYNSQPQQHGPLPPVPQAPPPPPYPAHAQRRDQWKDYVIGAGVAGLLSWGAWKAFEAYSPVEVRWKSSESSSTRATSSAARPLKRQESIIGAGGGARSGRQQTCSSESEMERLPREAPRALPAPPAATPKMADALSVSQAAASPASADSVKQTTELQERIKTLEQELVDTKAMLDKERRDRAELAVGNGKLKGQVTSLGRQNDKNSAEVLRLSTELSSVKAELERKVNPVVVPLAAAAAGAADGGDTLPLSTNSNDSAPVAASLEQPSNSPKDTEAPTTSTTNDAVTTTSCAGAAISAMPEPAAAAAAAAAAA
jgi:peroxin-14